MMAVEITRVQGWMTEHREDLCVPAGTGRLVDVGDLKHPDLNDVTETR